MPENLEVLLVLYFTSLGDLKRRKGKKNMNFCDLVAIYFLCLLKWESFHFVFKYFR